MEDEPEVLREEERYLSFKGQYQESIAAGERAIQVLPDDRDVIVYLGYDFLHLDRYDDLLNLTKKYDSVLPKEPDIRFSPVTCISTTTNWRRRVRISPRRCSVTHRRHGLREPRLRPARSPQASGGGGGFRSCPEA